MISENRQIAVVSITTAGDNTVIAAPTGTSEFLAIDYLYIIPDTAVGITLKTGSTALSGTFALAISQPIVLGNSDQDPNGLLKCGVNEAFVIGLSAGGQVSGFVKYRIVNR